jgi:hypothetical protein
MRAAKAVNNDCPCELRSLAGLLERQKITDAEFKAAQVYLEMAHIARAEIDSQMNEVNRSIVSNIVLKQLTPGAAVYAATACHPAGILRRIREALDQLGLALRMDSRSVF